MTTIGTFTKSGDIYTGSIRTLALSVESIVIRPVERPNERAPTHRVHVGNAELGAAWQRVGEESGEPYLAVKLDDPSFSGSVSASLVHAESNRFDLIWSRKARK